jgi:hypothetical protein
MAGAKGDHGTDLEAVGTEPARTPRRVRLPEHGARRNPDRHSARCAGGALERDRAVFQPVNVTLTARFSKKLNCATKTVDMKVVDETSSTTFAKVVLCFSRRFEQERQAKLGFCRVLMNSENCS